MPTPAPRQRPAAGCLGPAAALLLLVAGSAALRGCDESQRPHLHRAARDGDVAEIDRLLREGADVNGRGYPHNTTALHAAALHGRRDAAGLLLDRGADVNARDRDGFTPLHRAADEIGKNGARRDTRPGRLAVARLLLYHGAHIDSPTRNGYTPLHRTVSSNYVELAKLLLDYGANPNARDDYKGTPLHLAAYAGPDRAEMTRLLLSRGADPTARDERGKTPFDYAKDHNRGAAAALGQPAPATQPSP